MTWEIFLKLGDFIWNEEKMLIYWLLSIFHIIGEETFSYGCGGTGKKSFNCTFEDYGKRFAENDVIICCLVFIFLLLGVRKCFTQKSRSGCVVQFRVIPSHQIPAVTISVMILGHS